MQPFKVLTAVAAPLPHPDVDAFVRTRSARHAKILVTGTDLGPGSASDEAARLLADHGIRCVISSSIVNRFSTSCVSSGILPITLPEAELQALLGDAANPESALMTIDLPQQEIVRAGGLVLKFRIERSVKERLLLGAS
jgi:3-isopropylmalate/(R)-2-methylmalate dehydratase small subunit